MTLEAQRHEGLWLGQKANVVLIDQHQPISFGGTIADDQGLLDTSLELGKVVMLLSPSTGSCASGSLRYLEPCPYWFGWRDVTPAIPESRNLGEVASEVKEMVGLPVHDTVRLFGIKRRHYYNVLSGVSPSKMVEMRIRKVHSILADFSAAINGTEISVRDALLTPIAPDRTSLLELFEADDQVAIEDAVRELTNRIENSELAGMIPRPSPAYAPLSSEEEQVEQMRNSL